MTENVRQVFTHTRFDTSVACCVAGSVCGTPIRHPTKELVPTDFFTILRFRLSGSAVYWPRRFLRFRRKACSARVSRRRRNDRPVSWRASNRETSGRTRCGVGRPAHSEEKRLTSESQLEGYKERDHHRLVVCTNMIRVPPRLIVPMLIAVSVTTVGSHAWGSIMTDEAVLSPRSEAGSASTPFPASIPNPEEFPKCLSS